MINPALKLLFSFPFKSFLFSDLNKNDFEDEKYFDTILLYIAEKNPPVFSLEIDKITYNPHNIPIDPLFIEKMFSGNIIGGNVISFNATESTNDIAWGHVCTGESGMVVLSETQRSGRGRFSNRQWIDTPGDSILMSVLLKSDLISPDILSVAAGIAVSEAVGEFCHLNTRIKWPNDILVGTKKLSGVMVESRVVDNVRWYVLGIGINCNQQAEQFPESISQHATSIYLENALEVDRNALVLFILEKLDEILAGNKCRNELSQRWSAQNESLSSRIRLMHKGVIYDGTVERIDPFRGIFLRLDDGSELFCDAQTSTIISF